MKIKILETTEVKLPTDKKVVKYRVKKKGKVYELQALNKKGEIVSLTGGHTESEIANIKKKV